MRELPFSIALLITTITALHLTVSCQALHVLTFGDSLTRGCCTVPRGPEWPGANHPYSIRLQELLREVVHPDTEVTQAGVPNERVLGTMAARLQHHLAGLLVTTTGGGPRHIARRRPRSAPSGRRTSDEDSSLPLPSQGGQANAAAEHRHHHYDWVVILAGINDVAQGSSAMEIFHGSGGVRIRPPEREGIRGGEGGDNSGSGGGEWGGLGEGLLGMYETARRHGARILAMTCMENESSLNRMLRPLYRDEERKELNRMIREHVKAAAALDAEEKGEKGPTVQGGGTGGTGEGSASVGDSIGAGGGEPRRDSGRSPIVLCDLEKLLPYPGSEGLFSDGVHLTAKGYDRMGEIVFRCLEPEL